MIMAISYSLYGAYDMDPSMDSILYGPYCMCHRDDHYLYGISYTIYIYRKLIMGFALSSMLTNTETKIIIITVGKVSIAESHHNFKESLPQASQFPNRRVS